MQHNKLNLALIGYGKMGKIIESLALTIGHQITLKTNRSSPLADNLDTLQNCDVAIEFTSPEEAPNNLRHLADYNVPTVCGSTGWLNNWKDITAHFKEKQTPLVYASNFSVGVNIFWQINRQLASIMNRYSDYTPSIFESHHIEKKDAPSGTAVTTAEQIIERLDRTSGWTMDAPSEDQISMEAERVGDVKGFHRVSYTSEVDKITISHKAFSREGFASGALLAAEWVIGRQGIFGMEDVLNM